MKAIAYPLVGTWYPSNLRGMISLDWVTCNSALEGGNSFLLVEVRDRAWAQIVVDDEYGSKLFCLRRG